MVENGVDRLITTDEYIGILRDRKFKILNCGKKCPNGKLYHTKGNMNSILTDLEDEMYLPTKTLAKTEDYLKLNLQVDGLLRHFHAIIFWENDEVTKILELSKRNQDGTLMWNPCYTLTGGFATSIWIDEYMKKLGIEAYAERVQ